MNSDTSLILRSQFDEDGHLILQIPEEATDEQRDMLAMYLNPSEKLWDHLGEDFLFVGLIWYDDFKRDLAGNFVRVIDEETGEQTDELVKCKTTILLCHDGFLLYTHSDIFYGWVKETLLPLYGKFVNGRPLQGVLRKPVHVKIGKTVYRKSARSGFKPIILPDTGTNIMIVH